MVVRSLDLVKEGLLNVGFRQDRLRIAVPLPHTPLRKVPLMAYSDQPFDARTSLLAAVDEDFDEGALALLRPLGASVIAQCSADHVIFWRQSSQKAHFLERVPNENITSFFQAHREELAPGALYRSKVWGRVEESVQTTFVDTGFLPVVEQTAGEDLRSLLERCVTYTKNSLGWAKEMKVSDGYWLLKSVFWLLSAKILQDKSVPGFKSLDWNNLEGVYQRLAKHYNQKDPRPVQIGNARRRNALLGAAELIKNFGHCGAVTTESLAWVYESALIDRETRQKFGTHSTPTWLIDEIVAKLRPWIEAMPQEERMVFEPACGHAGFLISAMRLLSELLPQQLPSERKAYLRKRLHGVEIDSFAYEIAKLSLTLADVPNDNGWMLDNSDMFVGDKLSTAIAKANIVLANPPFERFEGERPAGAMIKRSDEVFRQIVDALPLNGVFGVVLPQTVLHSTQCKAIRRKLLEEYEISEITLFADKIFNYGEPETAVIIGRRVGKGAKRRALTFRRVREESIDHYVETLCPTSESSIRPEELTDSLALPHLHDLWASIANLSKLGDFIEGGKGFEHKGASDPAVMNGLELESESEQPGFEKGFAEWSDQQMTHELPVSTFLNLTKDALRQRGAKRYGTVIGQEQIILNHGRVSRTVWRLQALLDLKGHAVKGRFLVWRPKTKKISTKVLWAVLNSPVANAFTYCHSSTRDVLGKTVKAIPVFDMTSKDLRPLETAVGEYLAAANSKEHRIVKSRKASQKASDQMRFSLNDVTDFTPHEEENLKHLHWRVDAEVLRLYDLSPDQEADLLRLFEGVRRRGVPFVQDGYLPKGLAGISRLSEVIAITADWEIHNARRCQLIRKDVKSTLDEVEASELEMLEALADLRIAYAECLDPSPTDEMAKIIERLKKEGKWKG